MTFEQFQATKQHASDFGAVLKDAGLIGLAGFLYVGELYIGDTNVWPGCAHKEGRYYLLIDRSEYVSNDLEQLERLLYKFACDEGYTA